MGTGTRSSWNEQAAERLADAVAALANERDVDRVCALALEAALAISGAAGGEVVAADENGVTAPRARAGEERGQRPPEVTELTTGGRTLGRLVVWGDRPAGAPALRVLAAQLSQVLANLLMEGAVARQRGRARRFAEAVRALRDAHPTETAVLRVLEEARRLVGGVAAALVTGLPHDPGPTVSLGLEPSLEREVAGLVPAAAGPLGDGHGWAGPVPPGTPLRAAGMCALAIVPVGDPRERIGALCVLTAGPGALATDELETLLSLADHATTALGAAALRERLEDLATVDPATRFFNARYFRTRLEQESHRALRNGDTLSLLVVGLDGLAQVRAASGHAEAERAVSALAEFMVPRLRATDVGCRVGTDELAVILPSAAGLEAYLVAERIRAGFAPDAALGFGVSLSVGVASFPDPAGTADQLEAFAQAALGYARRAGGDHVFLYDREIAAGIEEEDRRERVAADAMLTTMSALAAAVDERHPSTRDHSRNVARVAALLAAELGLPGDRVEDVRLAGLLHDVGKVGVSEELLTRAGPLTAEEWAEVRQHPEIGYRMLSGPRMRGVREWIRHHHERPDGAGYPAGLRGDAIPLEARILSVANALDAMTGDRPYRPGVALEDALCAIDEAAGAQFDPAVVEVLLRLVARGEIGGPASEGEGR
ncbi:MAG TPA: HD domain-containing phosphohydrolase [Miltoncostaeaceae bacterium]|nr:HD domain-containing phosphohydrolase [Miltoncostaeaceae bacterium]